MHCSNFTALTVAISLLAMATTSRAQCYVCDEVVEITEPFARCFLENFDVLKRAYTDPAQVYQIVNLASCDQKSDVSGERSGLIVMGTLPPSDSGGVKAVYILDQERAFCLRALIENNLDELDPSAVFDLAEQCIDER